MHQRSTLAAIARSDALKYYHGGFQQYIGCAGAEDGPMYCPYCKQEMSLYEDGYHCSSGSLFSRKTSEHFNNELVSIMDAIIAREDSPDGRFFCVLCGMKMKRINDDEEQCCACGFLLTKAILFQLIELEPHLSQTKRR